MKILYYVRKYYTIYDWNRAASCLIICDDGVEGCCFIGWELIMDLIMAWVGHMDAKKEKGDEKVKVARCIEILMEGV